MKKILALVMCIFVVFIMCGCDATVNVVQNNMSDMRINYFEGKDENIYVNLSCGYREENFVYDGISTNPVECGVLILGYFNTCTYASISVILTVDNIETEYILEKSPYENVFMEDIGKILTEKNQISLKLKNQENEINIVCISKEWEIDYKKAIEIGVTHFKQEINNLYVNNSFNAEGYLKVLSKIDYENKYWYFSIIDGFGNNYSLLIDVNTAEVIAN